MHWGDCMDQMIKGVFDSCGMDIARADFENYLYIYNAKDRVSVEVEDGKVVRVTNERFEM